MTKHIKNAPKRFYVYLLRDSRDDSIFYVGCTNNPAKRGLSAKSYDPPVGPRIGEIRAGGGAPIRQIVGVFGTREHAAYQETHAIEVFRQKGQTLLNSEYRRTYQRTTAELEEEWGPIAPPEDRSRWGKRLRARYAGLRKPRMSFKERQVWIRENLA